MVNIFWLAWEKRKTVPQFLVLSGGGTVTSLGAAECWGCEDLWQGIYLGATSVWEVSPLLHWHSERDEPMEVTINKVHYSNLGQTSSSPWVSSSFTKPPLLAFFFVSLWLFLFFCFSKIQDFSMEQKWLLNYKQLFPIISIYPLSLIIFEDTKL